MPGNFGVRVIDTMMPTNLSDVFRERQNTNIGQFACLNTQIPVPELLSQPNTVDYLTDDESEDGKGFELKVPNLDELINQFEAPDETIGKANESFKQHLADLKQRGFVKETREEIEQRR